MSRDVGAAARGAGGARGFWLRGGALVLLALVIGLVAGAASAQVTAPESRGLQNLIGGRVTSITVDWECLYRVQPTNGVGSPVGDPVDLVLNRGSLRDGRVVESRGWGSFGTGDDPPGVDATPAVTYAALCVPPSSSVQDYSAACREVLREAGVSSASGCRFSAVSGGLRREGSSDTTGTGLHEVAVLVPLGLGVLLVTVLMWTGYLLVRRIIRHAAGQDPDPGEPMDTDSEREIERCLTRVNEDGLQRRMKRPFREPRTRRRAASPGPDLWARVDDPRA